MNIIGLGGSDHDLSCCLLVEGDLVCYIEEERLSKDKHCIGVKSSLMKSIQYCLDYAGLKASDIDLFVTTDIFMTRLNTKQDYMNRLVRVNHHIAHMASSYYLSGFEESALFVSDGSGSVTSHHHAETISWGMAQKSDIKIISKIYGFNSVNPESRSVVKGNSFGRFYARMSRLCGFEYFNDGKLMGLSSYGTDRFVEQFETFFTSTGIPGQNLEIEIEFSDEQFKKLYGSLIACKDEGGQFQLKADYAYAAQKLLEVKTYELLRHLYEITKCPNLSYSGGVALNSVLNGKIKGNTPFQNVFIPPAPHDSGTAFGAALYAYYNILKKPYQAKTLLSPYWGKRYDLAQIKQALQKYSDQINYTVVQFNDEAIRDLTSKLVIGWFHGRGEMGPRALGNRSILADPRHWDMKDIINSKVKFRESFRPFAPVVLREHVSSFFQTDFEDNPYMLYVGNVTTDKQSDIPAVTHVDGTARLQTVDESTNPKLYSLIKGFYQKTGIPVLLNTSLNTKSKPIVETPNDAIDCLLESGLDVLYIDNFRITKQKG